MAVGRGRLVRAPEAVRACWLRMWSSYWRSEAMRSWKVMGEVMAVFCGDIRRSPGEQPDCPPKTEHEQASDRWNGSSEPVLCIGKTPVH
jgi:hypothetical protein